MALILGDGFDHYPTAKILSKWDGCFAVGLAVTGGGGVDISTSWGRLGSQGAKIAGGNPGLYKNLRTANSGYGYLGTALYVPNYVVGGYQRNIFSFWDAASSSVDLISVWLENDGSLTLRTGNFFIGRSAPYATTQPGQLAAATWYYVECKAKIHDGSGEIAIRINGSVVNWIGGGASYTGNTRRTGANNYFTSIGLGGGLGDTAAGWGGAYYDDFYYCDDTGAQNTSYLGDVHLGVIYPNGVGSANVWTPQGFAANWQCVSEHSPDDATSYVWSGTIGNDDLYTMDDTAATVNGIKGLLMNYRVMKDDATVRSYSSLVKPSGGAIAEVATRTTPYGAFVNQQDVCELNPTTGLAWTKAQVDAMEAGIRDKA